MASGTADPTPARAAPAATSQRWILGSWQDLVFFVATPVFVVPLVALVGRRFSLDEISAFVVAFGATGHHLPGMIRAYGDRALFARFRTRFIAAPIFFLAVCLLLHMNHLDSMTVILTFWGLWHGAAQIYGFERIYDTKAEIKSDLGARLDLALTVSWFWLAVVYSPGRMTDILREFYRAGGPLVSAGAYEGFVGFWTALTGLISAAFAAHFVVGWLRGDRRSGIKLALIVSSIAFWWYAMVGINNVVLGVALFEIFHDIQYLAIVWFYNRKRVEQTADLSASVRFLFRPKVVLIFVYVGLVLAYGYFAIAPKYVDRGILRDVLLSGVAASALLHFYYDGFIWKVRDLETRKGLGLSSAGAATESRDLLGWARHGAKFALFVVPLAVLATSQLGGHGANVAPYQNFVSIFPEHAPAHFNLAVYTEKAGQPMAAIAHFERAIELVPDYAEARTNLGAVLQELGNDELALTHYRAALESNPGLGKAQNNLAWLLAASAREDLRDPGQAVVWAERAIEVSGRREPERLDTLAVAYAANARFGDAIRIAEEAIRRANRRGKKRLVAEVEARLRGFRSGTPYVDH